MTKDEALRMALGALEYVYEGANNQGPHTGISWRCVSNKTGPVITAIREVLAQPEPAVQGEPVAWVGLTDAQIGAVAADIWGSILIAPQSYQAFARAIEAKLKEKNNG